MELKEKTLSSQLIFDGQVAHLYRDVVSLPDGGTSVREYIKHVGACAFCPSPTTARWCWNVNTATPWGGN